MVGFFASNNVVFPINTVYNPPVSPSFPQRTREKSLMKWENGLIPPAFSTGPTPPHACFTAHTDDLRPIECFLWGLGSQTEPYRLFVRVGALSEEPAKWDPEAPTLRNPTLEELMSAINHAVPAGASLQIAGALESKGTDQGAQLQEDPEGVEWIGLALIQTGVAEGSPAARRSLILEPGGMNHAD